MKKGDMLNKEEQVIDINVKKNILITQSYNKVSCRYEYNFYHLSTMAHWYTKAL